METNDSNIKPQSTGGLKIMTVFVVVLAAHVLVIGGITTYYLVKGGSADIALTDKPNKGAKGASDTTVTADNPLPAAIDKTASAPTAEAAGTPASAPEQTASTDTSASATSPIASTTGANSSAPTSPSPLLSEMVTTSPELAPIPAPTASVASGPVKMPAFQPDASPVAGTPYVVKAHDSLAKIARLNHTTVAKLKETNSLNTDLLRIGQKLVIPARTQVATTAAPASLDSSESTAILSGSAPASSMSPKPVKPVAKESAASVSPIATTVALQHHLYTVVKGDTLTKIAREFKTTPAALMTANNITDASKLSIGKKLKIPSQEARSAKNSEPTATPSNQPQTGDPTGQLANFIQ